MTKTPKQKAYAVMDRWFRDKPALLSFTLDGEAGGYTVVIKTTARRTHTTVGDTPMEAVTRMQQVYKDMKKVNKL